MFVGYRAIAIKLYRENGASSYLIFLVGNCK
uniref:Uncharacterized protein n=1 Tax=Arundo donax TaxID=35708 RepID=A0A0A9AAQ7_ARUDO